MLPYSYINPQQGITIYGYVKLNSVPVWQGSYPNPAGVNNPRGINIILVDPLSCSKLEWRQFDTHADPNAAKQLSNYLQQVNRGSIIVGVSADEPIHALASALPTLRKIGADVSDVQVRGAFGFVAQKGFPCKTVLRKALAQAESNANPPRFNATVTGTSPNIVGLDLTTLYHNHTTTKY